MQSNFEFSDITTRAYNYLKEELSYKYVTIRHYRSRWLPLKDYMANNGFEYLSPKVCTDFLFSLYNGRLHAELTDNEKLIEKSVSVLSEFMQTGSIKRNCKIRYLDGSIGGLMIEFLDVKNCQRLKKVTIDKIESHMSHFNSWLSLNRILKIEEVRHPEIIAYIKSLDSRKKALIHDTLMDLRGFFSFLHEKGIVAAEIVSFIPKDNYQKQAKLPSYYSEEEVNRVLSSVDRGNIVGKRDYAILVLAAYLGLRASDIAMLTFSNLHWSQHKITLMQYKTGKDITLPLLSVVGNALIDYIQYGRPKSTEQFIFLFVISPFLPIRPQAIAGMINRRFINAGFQSADRRHGGHALRHSLVKELLNHKQSLPIISEVLGHKNTASTRHYIRIDEVALSRCALEVPLVNPSFYTQKGGVLFV